MDPIKIDRINALAKKSKAEGLTEDEKKEQQLLRQEYIAEYRKSLQSTLDGVVLMDENGNKEKLKKKPLH